MELELREDGDGNKSRTSQSATAKIHTSDVVTCAKSAICPMLGTILIYEQVSESSAASSTDLSKENRPVVLMGSTQTKVHIFSEGSNDQVHKTR